MAQGSQMKDILDQMAQHKLEETWRLQDARRAFLAARPELARLEHAMVKSRLMAGRGKCSPEEAAQTAQTYTQAYAQALEAAHLPANAFTYTPRCPHCQDTGMVGSPVKHPCACAIRQLAGRIHAASHLDPEKNFAAFDLALFDDTQLLPRLQCTQRAMIRRLRDRAMAWCAKYPMVERPHWLLEGGTGLGKTYLLHCIGNALADRGFTVLLTSVYQLNQAVLSNWDADRLDLFMDVDVLLVDDLGAEPMLHKVTGETLFTLVNERQNLNRAVLFSTNLTTGDISNRYGERFCSRLTDKRKVSMYQLDGKDLRRSK